MTNDGTRLYDALNAAIPHMIRLGDFIGNAEGRCEAIAEAREAIREWCYDSKTDAMVAFAKKEES